MQGRSLLRTEAVPARHTVWRVGARGGGSADGGCSSRGRSGRAGSPFALRLCLALCLARIRRDCVGGNPNAREGSLHKLVATNNVAGVRLWLLNPFCRGMINDLNHAGETPLHVALQCCNPRILSLLLEPPPLQITPSLLASCAPRLTSSTRLSADAATQVDDSAAKSCGADVAAQTVSLEDVLAEKHVICSSKPAGHLGTSELACSATAAVAEAAAFEVAVATAARVDFSIPLDGIPTLHLLIGRTAFGAARGEDALECLKRVLLHIGRFQAGAVDRCPRCSPTKVKATAAATKALSEKRGGEAESMPAAVEGAMQSANQPAAAASPSGAEADVQPRCGCCGAPSPAPGWQSSAGDPAAENAQFCCPLYFSQNGGESEAADTILLDLEAMDLQGRTALHLACSFGVAPVAELLLHAGASPWARQLRVGQLPLHSAIDADDPACCLLLLRHTLPCRFLVNPMCRCSSPGESSTAAGAASQSSVLPLSNSTEARRLVFQLVRRCVRRGSWKCLRALLLYPTERVGGAAYDVAGSGAEAQTGKQPRRLQTDVATAASNAGKCKPDASPWCAALHLLLDGDTAGWSCLREQAWRAGSLCDLQEQLRRVLASTPACCQAAAASWGVDVTDADQGSSTVYSPKAESEKQRLLQALFAARAVDALEISRPAEGRTMVVTHALCLEHLPLPEPADMPLKRYKLMQRFPENPSRLEVVTSTRSGILRTREFSPLLWMDDPMPASMSDILRVHSMSYVARLKLRVEDAFGISTRLPSLTLPLRASATQALPAPSAAGTAALSAAAAALDAKLQGEQYEQQKRQHLENIGPGGRYSFVFADGDTPVTCFSWAAAVHAAGAVIAAVDAVCEGKCRNAFCAVRPPGHHLGNWGAAQTAANKLTDEDIAAGSQGFCLLNNVAIGASYAKYNYARKGIRRIAIVDFDVHHGNGTEQIIRNVGMKIRKVKQPQGAALRLYQRAADELRGSNWPPSGSDVSPRNTSAPSHSQQGRGVEPVSCDVDPSGADPPSSPAYPMGGSGKVAAGQPQQSLGAVDVPEWRGWRDERDAEELFFASIHAFDGSFYPGTGADCEDYSGPVVINVNILPHPAPPSRRECCCCEKCSTRECAGLRARRLSRGAAPRGERADAPTNLIVGAEGAVSAGKFPWACHFCRYPSLAPSSAAARRLFLKRIIRPLLRFAPDMLFISAGFDGHAQDQIGGAFGGFAEEDFRFFTHVLVRAAERTCQGRVVSVLEGGYSVSGGVSSTLAASVKEHLRGLMRTASGGPCVPEAAHDAQGEVFAGYASGGDPHVRDAGEHSWEDDIEVGDDAASEVTASDVEESWELITEDSPAELHAVSGDDACVSPSAHVEEALGLAGRLSKRGLDVVLRGEEAHADLTARASTGGTGCLDPGRECEANAARNRSPAEPLWSSARSGLLHQKRSPSLSEGILRLRELCQGPDGGRQ
ncbi:histone deacetylase HDAC5 [Besnoitia besnoiti]|uniref:Histone deacetylase HDAC5 n=1 Tax=Besnoitia besnoiti TaxID=94643 RepID=A0A2A9M905_BESBE|nr:histone deacetylase HDAC5 [Besnoitia besnoiti]PFH32801.1 histone deacetylase HDAC5 [Besnoitia besnoiti]